MKKKIIQKLSIFLLPVFVIGCNNQSQNENSNKTSQNIQPVLQSIKSQLTKGVEYSYFGDSSCTESENKKCIDRDMYERLCKANEGMTKFAAQMLTTFDFAAAALLNGGDVEETKVYWSDASQKCRASITVSGIYKGTSTRRNLNGSVSTFIVNDENKLLASSTNPMQ